MNGGSKLYGFIFFHEVTRRPAGEGLARLARLVAEGALWPRIEVEWPWTEIAEVAQRLPELLGLRFPGKGGAASRGTVMNSRDRGERRRWGDSRHSSHRGQRRRG